MAVRKMTFYVAVCDGCGRDYNDELMSATDISMAIEEATDDGWEEKPGESLFCDDCVFKKGQAV